MLIFLYLLLSSFEHLINPRHMRKGYGSHSVCECVCVCYHTSCYIPGLYNANKVPLGFLRHFQGINCADFVENVSFKSSGDIHRGLIH